MKEMKNEYFRWLDSKPQILKKGMADNKSSYALEIFSPDGADSFEIESNVIDYDNDRNTVNDWNNSDPQNKVIEDSYSGTSTPKEMFQKTKSYRKNSGRKIVKLHML